MRQPQGHRLVAATSAALVVVGSLWLGVSHGQAWTDATVPSVGSRPSHSGGATAVHSSLDDGAADQDLPAWSAPPESAPLEPAPLESGSDPVGPRLPIPIFVRIAAIDVATSIVPVGIRRDGAIAIPEDVSLVGWYRLGVPPGADRGSAVLVAHRDGRGQGPGVFYDLGSLEVGDGLAVDTASGDGLAYRVVARESIRKRRLPYEELFSADGSPRLTLISCGGYYDPDRGGYQDNIVVTAVPVAAS